MPTESSDCEYHLCLRYIRRQGTVFGGGEYAVRGESKKMPQSRTQFCDWDYTVALPQHMIPFRTKLVGDATTDWERITVESPDGCNTLVTLPGPTPV